MKWVDRLIHQCTKNESNTITTYRNMLQACMNTKSLIECRQLHAHMIITGVEQNDFWGSKLLNSYASCGSLVDAFLVFNKIPEKNSVSWNAMIRAHVENGNLEEAIEIYNQMQAAGVVPDNMTFPIVLKACASLGALQQGKEIHEKVVRFGFEDNVFVGTAIVDMYLKCGNVEVARQVFDKMPQRNVVSWTAMIAGCVQNGFAKEALELFGTMMLIADVKPCVVTVSSILPACTRLEALDHGKEIHSVVVKYGFEADNFVSCSLIDMYAKCGNLEDACQLFDKMSQKDVVLWTAIIAGCAQNGNADEALKFFYQMHCNGMKPNPLTISSVLPAFGHLKNLRGGQVIHDNVIKRGLESNLYVCSALIDMYVKCGQTKCAHKVFEDIPVRDRDVVSWNALILGYTQGGYGDTALALFREMQFSGVKPNSVSFASILSSCAHSAALQQGKEIHGYLIKSDFMIDDFVESSLISMYAKCGSIDIARRVFDKMFRRDAVSWNAIILGYGMHGNAQDALTLLHQMEQSGVKPDYITFMAVLSTCGHAGLVDEGCKYFDSMTRDYQITPRAEHYACMVDLFGRSGHLDEAHDVIKKMPVEPTCGVWGALLGACRMHCNVNLGEYAAEHLFQLDPGNASYYVLMSHIYAEAGRWDGVAKMRTMMRDKGLKKNPGCSWIEVKNRVHSFVHGDRSHPEWKNIWTMLETLHGQLKVAGYVPNHQDLLRDVDEEQEFILSA
ncbi:pentatricopeptide repeat-containing protein At1g11290, chloroplastic [Cryptomeria japonica]|uniref:pentatricopeptide repeat-containing protein At1g11290, chloroplastic n=1 Tax=Cryptomeria japonica TaxID=3369 RepID=UPI0027DA4E1C|nr:pentatricopeptide repeat-containing protein At1g11290, chloroplastic [Cryptomeria japonica]